MTDRRPILGITMGDPCGVGAEIIVKALAEAALRERARFAVFGLAEQMLYTADRLEVDLRARRVHHEEVRRFASDVVLLDYDELSLPATMPRGPSKLGGIASMEFCLGGIAAAREGLVDALVTAPISKTSWALAKHYKYPGHTELLADKCKVRRVAMMFVSPELKVVLATIHNALMDVRNRFTIGCVFNPIDLADQALREWFGIRKPHIAVAALNPHAGEDGRFGDEETRVIAPAILMAREAGINVTGPYPADSLFLPKMRRTYDCAVAMYHDQGLIPVKMLAWREAVNVTLGLPIIRTSPDHGTAFDIAGQDRADPASLVAAIRLAADLVGHRKRS